MSVITFAESNVSRGLSARRTKSPLGPTIEVISVKNIQWGGRGREDWPLPPIISDTLVTGMGPTSVGRGDPSWLNWEWLFLSLMLIYFDRCHSYLSSGEGCSFFSLSFLLSWVIFSFVFCVFSFWSDHQHQQPWSSSPPSLSDVSNFAFLSQSSVSTFLIFLNWNLKFVFSSLNLNNVRI